MLFNSLIFAFFLPTVFLLYWFVFNKSISFRNALLLAVSYVFYGWWDWRFLLLIILSSLADYLIGQKIHLTHQKKIKRRFLFLSLLINLGVLGFFKYFNFFADNLNEAFSNMGYHLDDVTLDIVLPVGISFYTFQTLSYTLDIYKGRLKPEKNIITFFAFVSFFPQLVAGPIERASNLLPQFNVVKKFKLAQAKDGMRLMMWGFFKKVVIADNCASLVKEYFENFDDLSGITLVFGALLFSFQIYCDFSGYSDIAIGTAKLFNFELMQNFKYPYLSRNITEFWKRWHISLSTWFRDYVYIPLGGNRLGNLGHIRNLLITFIVSGFWHGANWTFLIWGGLNGLYYIPELAFKGSFKKTPYIAFDKYLPSLKEFVGWGTTFMLTVVGWVFFRSETVNDAFRYLGNIFSKPFFIYKSDFGVYNIISNKLIVIFIVLLLLLEYLSRNKDHVLQIENQPAIIRWSIYYVVVLTIIGFGQFRQIDFIYFQF